MGTEATAFAYFLALLNCLNGLNVNRFTYLLHRVCVCVCVCLCVCLCVCTWQIFDALIVLTSFALDVIFVEGVVTHTQGEEAIALLIIFLLWRILRVINGKTVDLLLRIDFDSTTIRRPFDVTTVGLPVRVMLH